MTSYETYWATMFLIVAGSVGIGLMIGYAWGYRNGVLQVSESILDAEIIGEVANDRCYGTECILCGQEVE